MTVWDEVVGQPRAVATLQEAAVAAHGVVAGEPAAAGSMTHAWLFTGPPGSGRSVAARALAAAPARMTLISREIDPQKTDDLERTGRGGRLHALVRRRRYHLDRMINLLN